MHGRRSLRSTTEMSGRGSESVVSVRRVRFGSWEEYWAARNDPAVWLPLVRRALDLAGMSGAGSPTMLVPSQYPTARAGDVVVTIYPEEWDGRASYALEMEAHSIVDGQGLPIPRLLAHGEGPPWSWLIESAADGVAWIPSETSAFDFGAVLRRLHDTPHDRGLLLGWGRFRTLVVDELANLGRNDDRLAAFPSDLRPGLRELAESTYAAVDCRAPTRLLHGDVHGDNVFVDPVSAKLTAIIDLNEMYAGDPWYDLADACFRLLRGEPPLVERMLEGYGLVPMDRDETALRLLGWGLLHDFDGLTSVVQSRGVPTSSVREVARQLTGL